MRNSNRGIGLTAAERIAGLRARIDAKLEELRHDPNRFQTQRRMAGMHQRLANLLHEEGRDEEARVELENRPVLRQATRARRMLDDLSK